MSTTKWLQGEQQLSLYFTMEFIFHYKLASFYCIEWNSMCELWTKQGNEGNPLSFPFCTVNITFNQTWCKFQTHPHVSLLNFEIYAYVLFTFEIYAYVFIHFFQYILFYDKLSLGLSPKLYHVPTITAKLKSISVNIYHSLPGILNHMMQINHHR